MPEIPIRVGGTVAPEAVTGMLGGRTVFATGHGPGWRHLLYLQGCQFDCLACSGPLLMPRSPRGMLPVSVAEVIEPIAADVPFLSGVTISGGEPTVQPDFLLALLTRLRDDPRTARLTRFLATNGDVDPALWEALAPLLDGVLLDVKALDEDRHIVLTGRSNTRVLDSAVNLSARGLLHEVRLLLIPGINDSDEQLHRLATWLLGIDPDVRVRVVEFEKRGTRICARDLLTPRRSDLARYWRVLDSAGVQELSVP
ncbi:MAG: radical SAM protein [Kineosporiaceae bacterium]